MLADGHLTERSEWVQVNDVYPIIVSPSLVLFVLYTNECNSQHDRHHIVKFADDCCVLIKRGQILIVVL